MLLGFSSSVRWAFSYTSTTLAALSLTGTCLFAILAIKLKSQCALFTVNTMQLSSTCGRPTIPLDVLGPTAGTMGKLWVVERMDYVQRTEVHDFRGHFASRITPLIVRVGWRDKSRAEDWNPVAECFIRFAAAECLTAEIVDIFDSVGLESELGLIDRLFWPVLHVCGNPVIHLLKVSVSTMTWC